MSPARWSSTKTLVTARESPSSMVNRSRDQSQEAPRRLSCLMMVPPDSAFQAQILELHENLGDCPREPLVHGEPLAGPIAGGAEALELLDDGAARLRLPGPDLFQEFFPSERPPVRFLSLHELPLDHHLGGDAGMVGAGLPEHVAATHALEPH